MDRYEQMQTFVRVVEAGSISGAAERMNIAKSAVSRRLSQLEERLKVQLFRRTTRKLSLTDSGRGFYERCVRVLGDIEEAELSVSQAHSTLHGTLRVAVPLSFGLRHLSPAISEFMSAHPGLTIDLDFNDRQVDLLADGFDVAIRIARLESSSLIARRLAPIRHVVCASPAYLDVSGQPETPAELAAHRCLCYSNAPEPKVWRFSDPQGKEISVRINPQLSANNGDFLREAAVAGRGIIVEPTFIVYDAIERGELTPILRGYDSLTLSAYAVYPQTRHLSQRVRAFVGFLVERFQGTPYWDVPLGFQSRNHQR